jgi:hypothetical protein
MRMPKTLTPWGMRIFRYIQVRNWNLDILEDKSGIPKSTILRWMQGRTLPRLDSWIVLCDALASNEQEFDQIIKSTMESIVEYQLATSRYRRRAEKQLK